MSNRKNRRKKIKGQCFLCREYTTLTFEHIPPKSCLNNRQMRIYKLLDIDFEQSEVPFKEGAKYEQIRAMGKYCLCSKCNSFMGKHIVNGFKRYYLLERLQYFTDENYEYAYIEYVEEDYENFVKQCVFMSSSMLSPNNNPLPNEVVKIILKDVKYKFNNIKFKVCINEFPKVQSTGLTASLLGSGKIMTNSVLDFYLWKFIYQDQEEVKGMDLQNPEIILYGKVKYLQIPIFKGTHKLHFVDIKKDEKKSQ